MAKKTFSEEEILKLQQNPYVKKVSSTTITYTQDFREHYVNEHQKGIPPSIILEKAGLSRTILGKDRSDSLSRNLRKRAKAQDNMEDMRKTKSGQTLKRELSSEEKMVRLEQKIKYLEQENIFLKKINSLDKKARYMHGQKKNSKSSTKHANEITTS